MLNIISKRKTEFFLLIFVVSRLKRMVIPLKPKKPDSEYYSEYLIVVNDSIPLIYLYDNIYRIHELSYTSRFYLDGILKGG